MTYIYDLKLLDVKCSLEMTLTEMNSQVPSDPMRVKINKNDDKNRLIFKIFRDHPSSRLSLKLITGGSRKPRTDLPVRHLVVKTYFPVGSILVWLSLEVSRSVGCFASAA